MIAKRKGVVARRGLKEAWSKRPQVRHPVWPENSTYLKQREIIPGVVDNEMIRCQSAWTRSSSC